MNKPFYKHIDRKLLIRTGLSDKFLILITGYISLTVSYTRKRAVLKTAESGNYFCAKCINKKYMQYLNKITERRKLNLEAELYLFVLFSRTNVDINL